MEKEHFNYTYVYFGLDCPPSVMDDFKKILYANGIDRTDCLCRKTEEEIMGIEGLTPYMQKKLRDFMEKYDLKFGMTDDEILEYRDYDYFKSHPEEKALFYNDDEDAMDEIFQADFLKQMAKGRGKKADFETIELDSIEELQEDTPEPSTNLWCDFGSANKNGGNIINLVEQLNPSWSEHQVLSYIEQQIRDLKLDFSEDYNARLEEEEEKKRWLEGKRAEREEQLNQETVVEMVVPLSHPFLRDYVIQRRIDYSIAQRFCREVHYSLRGKSYYAIAFMNVANGMEARNKLNKRCIGKKSISAVYPMGTPPV